jgi:hypothetical protein
MDLLGQRGNYRTTDLDDDMNQLRGFRTRDFDEITRLVDGAMVN